MEQVWRLQTVQTRRFYTKANGRRFISHWIEGFISHNMPMNINKMKIKELKVPPKSTPNVGARDAG